MQASVFVQFAQQCLRWLLAWFLLELLTHFIYANSITKFQLWSRLRRSVYFGALEFAIVGFWMLMFIWLKVIVPVFNSHVLMELVFQFLVIWRLFQFFSIAEGIEPPENMSRCLCNNYDNEGFWRNWHCSFNLWLVRYMYLPLGGRKHKWLSIWPIFVFVGIWHDIEIRLFQWAWIIAALFFIELGVKYCGQRLFSAEFRRGNSYRHLSAAFGACNIFLLMTANMVGFAVGFHDAGAFLIEILNQPWFMCAVYITFYAAVQLMFSLRAWEKNALQRRNAA